MLIEDKTKRKWEWDFLFRNVSKEEKYLSAQIVSCLNTGDYEVFVSVLRSIVSKMCCIAYFVCVRM